MYQEEEVWQENGYDRLVPLYEEYWEQVVALKKSNKKLSNPHLICFPDNFEKQNKRLVTIGQQTGPKQWHQEIEIENNTGSITELMEAYYEFEVGCYYNSTFFQAVRKIECMLHIDPCESLWTEIDKMDLGGRKADAITSKSIYDAFPVLGRELKIANPHVVIFFTGPTYDDLIKNTIFKGVEYKNVGDIPKEHFAQLSLPNSANSELPEKTYRTYHPYHLRISKHKLWHQAFGEKGWFETALLSS